MMNRLLDRRRRNLKGCDENDNFTNSYDQSRSTCLVVVSY